MKRVVGFLAVAALLAACGQQAGPGKSSPTPSASPSPTATASPSAQPTASPSPSPSISESPAAWPPAGFVSGNVSGGSSAGIVRVTAVRVGAHDGYDRFVIEFSGPVPTYAVASRAGSLFTLSPSGKTVRLDGTNGVLVTVWHIDWTAYQGSTALLLGSAYLREARQVQNFEGVQQWGLGIAGAPAIRVFTLSGPPRLVVDVTAR